jgi:hypothetical protein
MEQVIRKSERVSHCEKVPGAFGSFKSHTGTPGGGKVGAVDVPSDYKFFPQIYQYFPPFRTNAEM